MTTTYELIARVEALEMNSSNEERMLVILDRIMSHLGRISDGVNAIESRLADILDALDRDDEGAAPDA